MNHSLVFDKEFGSVVASTDFHSEVNVQVCHNLTPFSKSLHSLGGSVHFRKPNLSEDGDENPKIC